MIEKEREREAAKQLSIQRKVAAQIIAKATAVVTTVSELEAKPEFSMIAAPLRDPLIEKRDFLAEAVSNASIVSDHNADASNLPELPDIKTVSDAVAAAKKQIALITNMLAAIARAR